MLFHNVVELAQSKWVAPIAFAPRKDGFLRFCVNYKKLKDQTRCDSYLIPWIEECVDSLRKAVVFSSIDASSGYRKVQIEDEDQNKTAFASRHGLYRFVPLPFGLKNAPGTSQRTMDAILASNK